MEPRRSVFAFAFQNPFCVLHAETIKLSERVLCARVLAGKYSRVRCNRALAVRARPHLPHIVLAAPEVGMP